MNKGVSASLLRPIFYSLATSAVLFTSLFLGMYYSKMDVPGSPFGGQESNLVLAGIFFAIVFAALFVASYLLFTRTKNVLRRVEPLNPIKKLSLGLNKKSILICWAIIFICWLPWLILYYPGAMNLDTINQLWQYATPAPTYYTTLDVHIDAEFIDHHPVFDTLLFGLFLSLGNAIGSQNVGIFIYVIVQSLACSAMLALSCCYLERLRVPKLFRLLLLIFVALFPPFPCYAAMMLKDSLFVVFFIPYLICCIEIFLTKGKCLEKLSFLIVFAVLISFCLVTKKTGLFVVGLTFVVMLVAYRSSWKPLVASFVAPFLIFSVAIPLFLYPILDVAPGGKQELMSVFFQQTAAYCITYADEVTEEEYEAIDAVLDIDNFAELYDPKLVDPVKNSIRRDVTTEDLLGYFRVWATQGWKHPAAYFEATTRVNIDLLAPTALIRFYWLPGEPKDHALLLENQGDAGIDIFKPEPIASMADSVKTTYYEVVGGSSVLSFLLSKGLWGFWIPFICIVVSFFNNKRSLIAFAPIIISLLFLIITPTASSRYIIPLLFTVPLLVGLMLSFVRSGSMKPSPAYLISGGPPLDEAQLTSDFRVALHAGGRPDPTVAYVGTASGDNIPFFEMIKAVLMKAGAKRVDMVPLLGDSADVDQAKRMLTEAEVVFLSGGEPEDGMDGLTAAGIDTLLVDLYHQGKPFIGISAGTIMMGKHWAHWDVKGENDTAHLIDCLGFFPMTFDAHGEEEDWHDLKGVLSCMDPGSKGYGLVKNGFYSIDGEGRITSYRDEPHVVINA